LWLLQATQMFASDAWVLDWKDKDTPVWRSLPVYYSANASNFLTSNRIMPMAVIGMRTALVHRAAASENAASTTQVGWGGEL
jgi:hypothetical protein